VTKRIIQSETKETSVHWVKRKIIRRRRTGEREEKKGNKANAENVEESRSEGSSVAEHDGCELVERVANRGPG
jgi:hypothetical protein